MASAASGLRAAPLLVDLHLVFDAVVQLEVVVLQRGGGARRQAAVGAGAVQQQAGAHGAQQHAQRAHHDDGEEDGVQRVQPGVVLLRHQRDRGRVDHGGRRGEQQRPARQDITWRNEISGSDTSAVRQGGVACDAVCNHQHLKPFGSISE